MATRTKRKSARAKAKTKRAAKRRRRVTVRPRRTREGAGLFGRIFLPMFLSLCIVLCLGVLGYLGYQSVAASNFFDVKHVEVVGTSRASKSEIEKIVTSETQKSGTWNADLGEIRAKVEKLAFVKSAAVSRILPGGIRVNISERIPNAIVRLNSGDFLVDAEGLILSAATKAEENLPFALSGWDESKTEKAMKDNLERIKTYRKMLGEWQHYDLAKRIKSVNLSDLREPKAIVEDSGANIIVALAKEDFAKSLRSALEAIAGKGEKIRSVNASGLYPVIEYLGLK